MNEEIPIVETITPVTEAAFDDVSLLLSQLTTTVFSVVLELGRSLLLANTTRLEGVTTIGVDEHCWSHRGIDRWVTVVGDLTTRPARLLDIVPGRSAEDTIAAYTATPKQGKRS